MATISSLYVKIQGDATGLQRSLATSTASLKSFGSSASTTSASAKTAFGGMTAALIGVAVAAKAAADFTKFESTMVRTVTLAGATEDQMRAASEEILNVSVGLGKGPQELADALYFTESAGIAASDAMGVVTVAAKASAVGLGDTATVTDALTSVLNAYGSENISAAQAADILTAAVRDGKGEADAIAAAIGRVIPIASQMGVSFDQVAAGIAALTQTGLDASEAVTALRGIMTGLLNPTSQAADALRSVGLSAGAVRASIADKGLLPTLQLLQDRFHGNVAQMGQVFGNVRALAGVMSLLGSNSADVAKVFEDVANSGGTVDAAFARVQQTAEFKLHAALAAVQVALIKIGAALAPLLKSLADLAPLFVALGDALGYVVEQVAPVADGFANAQTAVDVLGDSTKSMSDKASELGNVGLSNLHSGLKVLGFLLHADTSALDQTSAATDDAARSFDSMTSDALSNRTALMRHAGAVEQEQRALANAGRELDRYHEAMRAGAPLLRRFAETVGTTSQEIIAGMKKAATEGTAAVDGFIADTLGGLASWRTEVSSQLTDVGGVLSKLAGTENLTASQISAAFKQAAADARSFTEDLVTVAETGGQTGKDLAAALLEMGPSAAGLADVVANSGKDMREQLVGDFGAILSAGQTGASKLQTALVGPLKDIRSILVQIAKHFGVDVVLDDHGAASQLATFSHNLLALDGKTIHTNISLGLDQTFHGGGPVFHAGGEVQRLHSGSQSLVSGEVPAILQRGEFVIRRSAVQQIGVPALQAINRLHEGGTATALGILHRMEPKAVPAVVNVNTAPSARFDPKEMRFKLEVDRRKFTRSLDYDVISDGYW